MKFLFAAVPVAYESFNIWFVPNTSPDCASTPYTYSLVALQSTRLFAAENCVDIFHRQEYTNFARNGRIIRSKALLNLMKSFEICILLCMFFLPFDNLIIFSSLLEERKEDQLAGCLSKSVTTDLLMTLYFNAHLHQANCLSLLKYCLLLFGL